MKTNILGGFLFKAISMLSTFLLIPMTISYVNKELYGVWLTVSSIVQWIGFFDIGFGNGLRNCLTSSLAQKKLKAGRIYVSTTYFVMLVIFGSLGIILYIVSGSINWAKFLNVSIQYEVTLTKVVRIVLIAFCLQMILKLIQNVVQSYQWNSLGSAMDMLGNLLSLIFIGILTKTVAPSLIGIAFFFSLSPLIIFIIFSLVLYNTKLKGISPSFHYIQINKIREIFKLGGKFFVIQITMLVLYQMINILISRICGPSQVTVYNVTYKYLSASLMVFTIIIAPMWTAFTDAYTKNDFDWMKRIYKKISRLVLYSCLLIIFMDILSPIFFKIWLGERVNIPMRITILLSLYFMETLWNQLHIIIINGIGKVNIQLVISIAMMVLFIPLSLFLGKELGLEGIVISMIFVNSPNLFLLRVQVHKLINNKAMGIWNK